MTNTMKGGFLRDDSGALVLSAASDVVYASAYTLGRTDFRAIVRDAVDAAVAKITATGKGAVVQLPAGVLDWTTGEHSGTTLGVISGVGLPPNLAGRLTIRGAGADATTIKLTTAAVNAFWFKRPYANGSTPAVGDATNAAGDYTTFKNIVLEDFAVDGNNVSGMAHVVLGSIPGNNTQQIRQNYADIHVRRIHSYNVPESADTTSARRTHVSIIGTHVTALETTRTSTQRVSVEDCRFEGGAAGVEVTSFGVALVGGINHYYDRIFMRRCSLDIATTPTVGGSQTGFYVCGTGFGDYFEMESLRVKNISDDGLEIGAMQRGLIRDVELVDCFRDGFDIRMTHALQDVATAKLKFENVRVRVTSALGAVSGAPCRAFSLIADSDGAAGTQQFGHLVLEDFDYWNDGGSATKIQASSTGNTWRVVSASQVDVARFELIRPRVRLSNFAFDQLASPLTLVGYSPEILGTGVFKLQGGRFELASPTVTGNKSSSIFPLYCAPGGGSAVLEVDVNGFETDLGSALNLTATGGSVTLVTVGNVGTLSGKIRGVKAVRPTGVTGVSYKCFIISGTGTNNGVYIDGFDFSGASFPAAEFDFSSSGANGSKVILGDGITKDKTRWRGRKTVTGATTLDASYRDVGATTGSAYTLTLPASANFPIGEDLLIKDESGTAATNNLTIGRASSDTIDGAVSTVINTNFGSRRLRNRGSGIWSVI